METVNPNDPKAFPKLDFTKCPNCESDRRVANEVLKIEIEKGKMPKNSYAFLYTHQSVLAKDMQWLSAPMIVSYYDACVDCGTVYCVHAETKIVMQGGKNTPQNPFSVS